MLHSYAQESKMQENKTVTVVVPVFNTAEYIDRCLQSVATQTLGDIEVLCIDDGSTDDSPSRLKAWADKDNRVRIITFPQNKGVPYARNLAIDEARGKWIYFLDSDDWIDPDFLEAMVKEAEKTGRDVVINARYIYEYDDTSLNHPGKDQCVKQGVDGYYNPALVQSNMFPVVWLRLYRRSYLLSNGVRFPLLRGGIEDNYFVGLNELLQERSYIFHGPAYHYYQRRNSLVRTPGNGFRLIQNARLFYDELLRRGISTRGVRLVMVLADTDFKDADEYAFARKFFLDAEQAIRAEGDLYTLIVYALMDIVLSCPDLASYRKVCSPNFYVSYIRHNGIGARRR